MAKTADQAGDPVARAVAAVDSLLEQPKRHPTFEPQDEVSAAAAVERFAVGFASAAGWVKDVVEGARAGAENLSGDRLQGLSEIIQNADDAHARRVRLRLEADALLVAHDGRPVTLRDVYSLANPWVTSKSSDAAATGRFGIGLMTLQTLLSALEVFSGPYRFRIDESTLAVVKSRPWPLGLVSDGDTILRVPLDPGVLDVAALDAWFARWDEASLLLSFGPGDRGLQRRRASSRAPAVLGGPWERDSAGWWARGVHTPPLREGLEWPRVGGTDH